MIPFFSRLIRPFIYFALRQKINLEVFNLCSIILVIIGLIIMGSSISFTVVLVGIAIISTGQGLYRITLRRNLANEASITEPSALSRVSMFVLSSVIAPIVSYPLGFYVLNTWPKGGIVYVAIILILLVLIPILSSRTISQKETVPTGVLALSTKYALPSYVRNNIFNDLSDIIFGF